MAQSSKILVADDNLAIREYLDGLLHSDSIEIILAEDGNQALELVKTSGVDLLLLDVMMPQVNGMQVCRQIREDPNLSDMPIIMITALDDRKSRLQGLQAGADDFVSKPFDAQELTARVNTILRLNRFRRLHQEREKFERLIEFSPDGILLLNKNGIIQLANPAFNSMVGIQDPGHAINQGVEHFISPEDRVTFHFKLADLFNDQTSHLRFEVNLLHTDSQIIPAEIHGSLTKIGTSPSAQLIIHDITRRKQSEEALNKSHQELKSAYDATIEGWALTLELRDIETAGHSHRVIDLSVKLAKAMGFEGDALQEFIRGATLHDIGKIGIPDSILLKPDRLTQAEMELMRQHTRYAFNVLSKVGFKGPVVDIPHYHHERWDGTGYPDGLAKLQIPLSARIFALADVWDALNSDRPYRPAWPKSKIISYLVEQGGKQFDPEIVKVFLRLVT